MHTLINQSPFTRSELTYSHFENFSSTCSCSQNGNWFETKGQFPSLDWCFMEQLSLKCSLLKMIDYVHLLKTAAKAMICHHTAERQSCGIKFACQYTFLIIYYTFLIGICVGAVCIHVCLYVCMCKCKPDADVQCFDCFPLYLLSLTESHQLS